MIILSYKRKMNKFHLNYQDGNLKLQLPYVLHNAGPVRKDWRKTMKKYTWNEIYAAAEGCGCGESGLKAKDNARENVRCFALERGEADLEKAECPEDEVEYYCDKYSILFDVDGHIVDQN